MPNPFIGEIRAFGFNFAPRGWMFCNGAMLQISQFQTLFSLIGTTYGGDGRLTFQLPDLQGRTAINQGQGAGLSNRSIGYRSGVELNHIQTENLPSHSHELTVNVKCKGSPGNSNSATGNVWASDAGGSAVTYSSDPVDSDMASGAVVASCGNTGSNAGINNMQPFLVVNYCIAIEGEYPPRN